MGYAIVFSGIHRAYLMLLSAPIMSFRSTRNLPGDRKEWQPSRRERFNQPSTRALIGAILTDLGKGAITEKLMKSLNSLTFYTLPGITDVCLAAKGWNFKK